MLNLWTCFLCVTILHNFAFAKHSNRIQLFNCFTFKSIICIFSSIQKYDKHYSSTGGFEAGAFFHSVGDFCRIFSLSLLIGAVMGCVTALMTKFTRIRDFPLLESALFVLMSYSTFLIAEVTELTGGHKYRLIYYAKNMRTQLVHTLS